MNQRRADYRQPSRVVLFGSYAPSLIHFRGPLIRDMIARGHEVFAIAPDIDEGTAAALRELGAEPISVKLGRTSLDPREALRVQRRLRSLLLELRPQVIIAYTIKPILIGAPAARRAGVNHVVSLVTGLGYAFTGGRELNRLISRVMATILYRRAFRCSDVVVFQNEDDRRDFGRIGVLPRRVPTGLINGSGVDIDQFPASAPPDQVSFLMIARLVRDKGVREYAEAARRLKGLHPDVRVSLIGGLDSDPQAITVKELSQFQAAGVDYLGQQPDVRPFIAGHSVYVLPSYREGTPRSVLEALAMGRAVITCDVPGCRQTVDHGSNGFLVPARDVEALLKAMVHMVENPQLLGPMGAASRRKAEEKYDVRKVNAALLELARL